MRVGVDGYSTKPRVGRPTTASIVAPENPFLQTTLPQSPKMAALQTRDLFFSEHSDRARFSAFLRDPKQPREFLLSTTSTRKATVFSSVLPQAPQTYLLFGTHYQPQVSSLPNRVKVSPHGFTPPTFQARQNNPFLHHSAKKYASRLTQSLTPKEKSEPDIIARVISSRPLDPRYAVQLNEAFNKQKLDPLNPHWVHQDKVDHLIPLAVNHPIEAGFVQISHPWQSNILHGVYQIIHHLTGWHLSEAGLHLPNGAVISSHIQHWQDTFGNHVKLFQAFRLPESHAWQIATALESKQVFSPSQTTALKTLFEKALTMPTFASPNNLQMA